jgi:hypothetical protein
MNGAGNIKGSLPTRNPTVNRTQIDEKPANIHLSHTNKPFGAGLCQVDRSHEVFTSSKNIAHQHSRHVPTGYDTMSDNFIVSRETYPVC